MLDTATFFDHLFDYTKSNAMLVMDEDGIIIKANNAFFNAYGYTEDDIKGKNLSILFTETDQVSNLPEREIETTKAQGNSNDNNFLVHKDGSAIWTTGESVLIKDNEGKKYLVKTVHNIHTQKLLEKFLLESNEFIESIFSSINNVSLLVTDTRMKIIKVNNAFFEMFELEKEKIEGSRLSEIKHSFWQDKELQTKLNEIIMTRDFFKNKTYQMQSRNGASRTLSIFTQLIDGHLGIDKRILMVISDITNKV